MKNEDYLAAGHYFTRERCVVEKISTEDSETCDVIRQVENAVVRDSLGNARDSLRNRGADEYLNQFQLAIEDYKEALSIDPKNETVQQELRAAQERLAKFENDYQGIKKRLTELSEASSFDDATRKEIRMMIDRLRRSIKVRGVDEEDKKPDTGLVALATNIALTLEAGGNKQWAFEARQDVQILRGSVASAPVIQSGQSLIMGPKRQKLAVTTVAFQDGRSSGELVTPKSRKANGRSVAKKAESKLAVAPAIIPPAEIRPAEPMVLPAPDPAEVQKAQEKIQAKLKEASNLFKEEKKEAIGVYAEILGMAFLTDADKGRVISSLNRLKNAFPDEFKKVFPNGIR